MAASDHPMKTYTYTVHIEPAEEGGFNVLVPALPGCVTQGATYEEAVAMAQEAIEGFLEALAQAGEEIPLEPQPSAPLTAAVRVRTPALV
jgi:antitoxin HicB